ncbi:short transient receptor potential channel 4-like [Gigantopelta aegis]|uniref:short transient receptor potential channel 4-like n=1 Tax=Gigantopelta aegis TaxID=1735272 RepID=UPI001B88BD2E|nr:short transient receptor potential channel 4-like [Gigantopelta aegis]
MDKVYMQYKQSLSNANKMMDELGVDADGDSFGMGIIRKEQDLSNEEKQYLLAVERGDVPSTRNVLNNLAVNRININCVDPLGRTALLIAIENENIEMIELLLSYNVEVGDALLHAINEQNVEAVELLLNHEVALKGEEALHSTESVPSSSFTPDITPIILAGHRDNYEIIQILLNRGYRIPKPHNVRCDCDDCVRGMEDDSLRHSRSRINAYKALASPSLIALSSKDPILTSFELSRELKTLSRLENEFKVDYEKLAQKCQDFAVDLLEQTRGSRELQIILNHDTSAAVANEKGAEKTKLSRLKLAIKYKQKKFVAHPNCQQLLASLWYEGLPGFRRRNILTKLLITQTIGIMFPFLSVVYLIAPKCAFGNIIRKPFIKFIVHSTSYLVFLFLLVLVSQRVELPTFYPEEEARRVAGSDVSSELRGAPASTVEMFILAYVAGLMWTEIKQLWNSGAKEYIYDMWNILDFVTNSLYVATFTLRLMAWVQVKHERDREDPRAELQRKDWDAYDPNLISEALFAAANIFSSLKLIYIFTVNPHLGPLQISLGRMIMDIMKFGCVYLIVLVSFASGLNHLYWYYATVRKDECEAGTEESCERKYKSFANLFEISQSLYWSIYGLVDLESAELRPRFKHEFTEFIGKLMFGTYSWIAFVVLLNMLIAMMSNSYQIIYSQADEEWKFARSKLWISYFEESGTLPPPFNIIPSPKTFYYVLLWFKNKLCACSKKQKRSRWQSIKKIVKKINEKELNYQVVMRDLVKRYIMQKQRSPDHGDGVTEDDINELKQDISSFRFELLEILRSNGMKTPNPNQQKPTNRRLSRKRSLMSLDRIKRSLSMEPLHELSTTQGNKPWKSSSLKMDTLSVDRAFIASTVPRVEVTNNTAIIRESIPEEMERKRRESMKAADLAEEFDRKRRESIKTEDLEKKRRESTKPDLAELLLKPADAARNASSHQETKADPNTSEFQVWEERPRLVNEIAQSAVDRPNSTESSGSHKKDEGLGESFDQYSELSDSLSRNGNHATGSESTVSDRFKAGASTPSLSTGNGSEVKAGSSSSPSLQSVNESPVDVLASICSSKRVTFM